MLLKWITIRPTDNKYGAFTAGQNAWSALADIPGFLWQIAGWFEGGESAFGAMAVWESFGLYREFMAAEHDRIAYCQEGTYVSTETCLSDVRMTIGDISDNFPPLAATYLRVADCRLLSGRADRFWQVQGEIWNPGMSATPGMLGGVVAAATAESDRCIVATVWQSQKAHADYQKLVFPGLRAKAPAEDHLASVRGFRMVLNPTWRVIRSGTESQA